MPCYTHPHAGCEHEITKIEQLKCDFENFVNNVKNEFIKAASEYDMEMDERVKYYKQKSDESTAMLCELMTEIIIHSPFFKLNEMQKEWYNKHKKFDNAKKDNVK